MQARESKRFQFRSKMLFFLILNSRKIVLIFVEDWICKFRAATWLDIILIKITKDIY